jgi:hypothetical protein
VPNDCRVGEEEQGLRDQGAERRHRETHDLGVVGMTQRWQTK